VGACWRSTVRAGAAPAAEDPLLEIIQFLIDFILHIDKHLEAFVVAYGPWV
jgi:membrane-associated protein